MERVQTISPPLGEYEWPTFGITLWDALGGPERVQPPGGGGKVAQKAGPQGGGWGVGRRASPKWAKRPATRRACL